MRRNLIALAGPAVLAIAMVAPAAAITGNYREDNDHPFVGLVAFYDSDWEFIHRCTGELLSPTVMLTAGHCTFGTGLNGEPTESGSGATTSGSASRRCRITASCRQARTSYRTTTRAGTTRGQGR